MVKRRDPPTLKSATAAQIEAFAAAADPSPLPSIDPQAIRDYKAIRVPFNEFEYRQLEQVARKTGRSKLNVIRWALTQLAQNLELKEH